MKGPDDFRNRNRVSRRCGVVAVAVASLFYLSCFSPILSFSHTCVPILSFASRAIDRTPLAVQSAMIGEIKADNKNE